MKKTASPHTRIVIALLVILPQFLIAQSKPDKQLVEKKKQIAVRFLETLESQDSIRAMQFFTPDLKEDDKVRLQQIVGKGARDMYQYKSYGFGIISAFPQDQIRFTCFYSNTNDLVVYEVYLTFTSAGDLYIIDIDLKDQKKLEDEKKKWQEVRKNTVTPPPPMINKN